MLFFRKLFPVLLAGLMFSPCLYAADSGDEQMENIIVSASRIPVTDIKAGSSYTIISNEDLKNRQAVFISEVLREVPGIAVSHSGVAGSQTQIRIRGAEANQVLVLIDGMDMNDLAGNDEFDVAKLLLTDVERVEILRGPQSSLWGSEALAGVINIITRRGSGRLNLGGYLEAGSFNTFHAGGELSGSGDKYHFSIRGSHFDSSGSNISRQGNEDDGYENKTFSFTAGLTPFHNLEIEIAGRHTIANSEIDDAGEGIPVDADKENGVKQNYGRVLARLTLFDNRWEHKVGAAINSTENDNFLNQGEIGSNQGKKYQFNYQSSLKFTFPAFPEINHTAILALENERQEFTQRGPVSFGFDPNQDQDMNITSYVGEYRLDLWERLFLSGSIRFDDNDAFPDTTTHRATLAWVIPDFGTRFHASYGTGVKNPTFIDRFGFFSAIGFGAPFIGNNNLEPEKSRGWDLGLEQALLDNRLVLDMTYFNERLFDEINGFVFDPVLNANTAINVSGTSKRAGYEFSLRAALLDNLDLSASYTYTDATQPDSDGFQVREVRRAEDIASVNLNYRFLNQRANLNLGVNYNGPQDDIYFPAPVFTSTRIELDSYTLVNLAGSYQIGQSAMLYARIDNLLDSDYEEVFGFQTPGIGAYVGVKLNFNK